MTPLSDSKKSATSVSQTEDYDASRVPNAWILPGAPTDEFWTDVPYEAVLDPAENILSPLKVTPGDALLFVDPQTLRPLAVARLCVPHVLPLPLPKDPDAPQDELRVRLYFDARLKLEGPAPLPFRVDLSSPNLPLEHLPLPQLDELLAHENLSFAKLPTFEDRAEEDRSLQNKYSGYVRDLLAQILEWNILGPADGPYEILDDPRVSSRYLVGFLVPNSVSPKGDASDQTDVPSEDGDDDLAAANDEDLIPSPKLDAELQEDRKAAFYERPKNYSAYSESSTKNDDGQEIKDDGKEDADDDSIALARRATSRPSSLGMTFCVARKVDEIEVEASWGIYTKEEIPDPKDAESVKRVWRRTPRGDRQRVRLPSAGNIDFSPIDESGDINLTGSVSTPQNVDAKIVTIFLSNNQAEKKKNKDEGALFQARLRVRSPRGDAIFVSRNIALAPIRNRANGASMEEQELAFLYRNRQEFAVGHNVSTRVERYASDPRLATAIETTFLPSYDLPVSQENKSEELVALKENGAFDMKRLGKMKRAESIPLLRSFVDDYAAWIDKTWNPLEKDAAEGFDEGTIKNLRGNCEAALKRLREGVDVLEKNDVAYRAFAFMNRVMAEQRARYEAVKEFARADDESLKSSKKAAGVNRVEPELPLKKYQEPRYCSWRPFQLAFILLTLPSLADPNHPDRTRENGESVSGAPLDLLWFPTGGGKTEAYLGLAAFAIAARRLQKEKDFSNYDASGGTTVLMRYTLRLLTIQQFQRAATLFCAMEHERMKDEKTWGEERFTLGLWVGQKTTPNTTKQAKKYLDGGDYNGSSPLQFTRCPWCGRLVETQGVISDENAGATRVFCSGRRSCEFGSDTNGGIPVMTVDEEIYRRPPSMLISTIDKFAMLPWRNETRTLFGIHEKRCERHHLVWPGNDCDGVSRHGKKKGEKDPAPRIVNFNKDYKKIGYRPPDLVIQDELHLINGPLGSLAGLYEGAIDSLCAWTDVAGRRHYAKIVASTATARLAERQCRNLYNRAAKVFPPSGASVDDNYFNCQKEPTRDAPGRRYLGVCAPGITTQSGSVVLYATLMTAAKFLFNSFGALADPYMTLVGYYSSLRELGGARRLAEDNVQTYVTRVNRVPGKKPRPGLYARAYGGYAQELTSRVSASRIPVILQSLERKFTRGSSGVHVALATNMLSVGVDVPRLGLMLVQSQPKNTAEYIQATSRVGRRNPGLVVTYLLWTRPRDVSHFETFEHFHETFYSRVEAPSVTPYSPRALERGLPGVVVGIVRSKIAELSANYDAAKFKDEFVARERVEKEFDELFRRVEDVAGKEKADSVRLMVKNLLDEWQHKVGREEYSYVGGQKDNVKYLPLLSEPGKKREKFASVTSMRDVEPDVDLTLNKFVSDFPYQNVETEETQENQEEAEDEQ